jgi:hypothetical protein
MGYAIGLRAEEHGTKSLRRTKAALIYKATGNLRVIQILLGHTKIENTVRYLGVDIDALTPAERMKEPCGYGEAPYPAFLRPFESRFVLLRRLFKRFRCLLHRKMPVGLVLSPRSKLSAILNESAAGAG